MQRNEVESFQHFIFNTIDSIVDILDGLSAEELNWRPAAPATNSLYAIATHVLGNAEENLLGTLCREPHHRDYANEFSAAAPDAGDELFDLVHDRVGRVAERHVVDALQLDELRRECSRRGGGRRRWARTGHASCG